MKRRNFSSELKRESAQLVVDQSYTEAEAASVMDVGLSSMVTSGPAQPFIHEMSHVWQRERRKFGFSRQYIRCTLL